MAKKLVFDKVLFTTVVTLVAAGLVAVYSASAAAVRGPSFGVSPFLVKQTLAAGLGLAVMAAAMVLDYRTLRRPLLVYALLGTALVLLIAVLFAPPLNNSRRWFLIGGFSLQPSEIAKLALVVFLAYQIDKKQDRIHHPHFLIPVLVTSALAIGLVAVEPDLGTAVILASVPALMLVLAGLSWRYLAVGGLAVLPIFYHFVVSEPYRLARLTAFLHPERDPLGSGFQPLQSLIAVGSGGIAGRGLGASLQKLYFLPNPYSDFVYSIVAEELGLVGALVLLGLFAVLFWRGARAGLRAPDGFGRYLAWGLTGVLMAQALINISVALSLLPTTGIPLPFISYGGSSLVVSMAAAGVVLNISQHG